MSPEFLMTFSGRRLRSVLIGRCRRIPATALRDFLNSLTD
jgi:hypothetical protein